MCKNNLFDSEVVGGKHTGKRNSRQCWISKKHKLVEPIFTKASSLFNIPFEHGEDLQVVRYSPNQYYKEHHDSCCDNDHRCSTFLSRGGHRVLTILIYLSNEFTAGETYFKNLNKKFKPNIGDALIFYPLASNVK